MKKSSTSRLESKTDWERLENMRDEDIDLSDIPEITAEQFAKAKPTAEFFKERGLHFDPAEPIEVTEYYEDGTSKTYILDSKSNVIRLDPDVQKYFPDSKAVNEALRGLIALIPDKRPESAG